MPDSDSYYNDPVWGPGPVHVLREELGAGGLLLTACWKPAGGVLWNANGGPTSCEACKAAVVEEALQEGP